MGAGIKHGDERRIRGKGLPHFDEPKKRGDVIVKFSIDFPDQLTDEQRRIVEEILPIDIAEYE
jgi:DnaJ-class molecular chaperone